MTSSTLHSPALVDVTTGPRHGARTPLPHTGLVVLGRDPGCDVVLSDPSVSRRHAALQWEGDELWLEDLRSLGGTYVNRERLSTPRRLVNGDSIQLASLHLRYEGPGQPALAKTQVVPRVVQPAAAPRYDVGSQAADMINNVGGDQYLSYVQHVQQQRESFGREIAAARTKAWWLVWLGVGITVAGLAGALWLMAGYLGQFATYLRMLLGSTSDPRDQQRAVDAFGKVVDAMTGQDVLGVPVLVWVSLATTAGPVLMIIGIVGHVRAAARRKRVDRELPLPTPPWTAATQQGRSR